MLISIVENLLVSAFVVGFRKMNKESVEQELEDFFFKKVLVGPKTNTALYGNSFLFAGFDENGFLHALVSYLDENTCLIMLSVDCEAFPRLKEVKDQIKAKLRRNNCFHEIALGLRETDTFNVSHTGVFKLSCVQKLLQ